MNLRLAYGKKGLDVELPDNAAVDIIEPRFVPGLPDQGKAVTAALADPENSKPLWELAGRNDKIAIIFSDITRATPYHTILPPLLAELNHIPDKQLTFFCATGTHRPATREELVSILGENIAGRYKIVQNQANDKKLFNLAGKTRKGNEIWLNREVMDHNLVILTGFIEPHFFVGFSGGGKSLMPGMAYEETIRRNHSIANLSDDRVRWGITDGNPLWEEVMEAAEMAPPLFLLNVTLNREKQITGVFAGDLRSSHKKGCAFAKSSAMVAVKEPYDVVITSNSGYPLDLNVYQSVKGMSAAAQVVKTGGHIIVAAECWDGIPEGSDYEKILTAAGSVDQLMSYIKDRENVLKDTWQVYFQALIQQKAKVYLYSDKLSDHTIKKALLVPSGDIGELVRDLLRETGSVSRICVLPEGPQTIPYLS